MKKFKKSIVALSLSTAMLAIAGFGTLAYFTDTETASNSFTVGKVDIDLREESWHEENGVIIPGRTIEKDPTVIIQQGSVESYVRMVVKMPENLFRVSNLANAQDPAITFNDMDNEVWIMSEPMSIDGEVTIVFTYHEKVAAPTDVVKLEPLFTELAIGNHVDNEVAALLGEKFNIDVSALAVQAEGFTNAEDAFTAAF